MFQKQNLIAGHVSCLFEQSTAESGAAIAVLSSRVPYPRRQRPGATCLNMSNSDISKYQLLGFEFDSPFSLYLFHQGKKGAANKAPNFAFKT
ncbi:hypothetical protein V6N13_023633 [Hibiscus sabdariffa]